MAATVKETILSLAAERGPDKTICPSEVVRRLWPDDWRPHMEEIRKAAYGLRAEGKIRILQKGIEIRDDVAEGPIRIAIV